LLSLPTHLEDQKKQTSRCVFVAAADVSQTAALQLCDANISMEFLIPSHAFVIIAEYRRHFDVLCLLQHQGAHAVTESSCYKPEGHGFDSR
jgi:hypothetical protein